MLKVGDREPLEDTVAAKDNLAFVAFTLSHSPCGDRVIEARLGERLLLQWCLDCAQMRIFRFPGA